ncbi:MAG TPA: alpha/beta-hydrolase family protein [Patescibacteria group bacterium]|nr:alpha/beta-hydrolase family protein [Patescibacteria group bacterium]
MPKSAPKQQFAKNAVVILKSRLRLSGLIVAITAFSFAMTPSLLPRPPIYMGAIAGVAAGLGYGFGILLAWFFNRYISVKIPSKVLNWLWYVVPAAGFLLVVLMTIVGTRWQNDVRSLVGEEDLGGRPIFAIFASALIFAGLVIVIGRFLRIFNRSIRHLLIKIMPGKAAALLGVAVVIVLAFLLVKGVAYNAFIHVAKSTYSSRNASTPEGIKQPTSMYVSGGEGSLVPWNSLGYMGKKFAARVPDPSLISAWSGQPAKSQIRAYAGVLSADTPEARAKLALDELKRTGAFSRRYLVVATATGTGWIEPQTADAIAYLTNGDSAIAAIQYSYLPSWISMLVDSKNATDAGKALYDTVYDYWRTLPADSRPQLIAYGLSLGSYGGQAAFSGLSDFQQRSQGALYVGSPSGSSLWSEFTDRRDKGSPEILPVYGGGEHVRFAARNTDITQNTDIWQTPRLLYLQHPSDSVVWFSSDLIFNKPDWLKEPRGYDVAKSMQWIPVVTFLQVTVDQFFGTTVPNGHGHNYGDITVSAWESILENMAWSQQQQNQLSEKIAAYPIE